VIRPMATAGSLVNGLVNAPLKAVRIVLQTRHSISFFGLPCAAQGRRLGWVFGEPVSVAQSCLMAGVTIPAQGWYLVSMRTEPRARLSILTNFQFMPKI
jgi:hypothetical protein